MHTAVSGAVNFVQRSVVDKEKRADRATASSHASSSSSIPSFPFPSSPLLPFDDAEEDDDGAEVGRAAAKAFREARRCRTTDSPSVHDDIAGRK